ncbi:MAG: ATP-binding protein [Candidatus Limnocylindria bacterium]
MSELLDRVASGRGQDREAVDTLASMLDQLTRSFRCDRALVLLHDEDLDVLRGSFGLELPDEIVQGLAIPLAEDTLLPAVLRTGVPQLVNDLRSDPRIGENTRALLRELGLTRFAAAPLTAPGRGPIGVILLGRTDPFTPEELVSLIAATSEAGDAFTLARARVAVREAEAVDREWLWAMVSAIADPVVVTNGRNDIVVQNRRAEELFRSREDDLPGKRQAVSMNNFMFTAALSKWTLEAGQPAGAPRELTLVDPIEGVEIIFEVIAIPATNYRNGERGMVSVLKEVTDIRHMTEELARNLERLQSADEEMKVERDRLDLILRSVPNPIVVIDNENRPVRMNAAAQRLLRPGTAAVGRSVQIALANETRFTSFIGQTALDEDRRHTGEITLVDPETEELLELSATVAEVRDDHGAVVATVSVLQDIGRLRELERRRVEQILFDSEKLAATGRLAASIAHEINNPLEAVKNALYLLVHRLPQEDPSHRFLGIALKETERMGRILRQMLGFYRPTGELVPLDINALIGEAYALIAKRLAERRVRVEERFEPHLPPIQGSADQLKQVILNLLLNGAESMPEGGTITVTTRAVPAGGPGFLGQGALQVEVRDTGMGIPEEHLSHIFEPFFSTKQGKGTGLGLWVSSGIVNAHGGSLQVRSVPGRGTTFTMTLPIGGPPSDERE